MSSKVEALVRNFLNMEGEALCLVPGEKITILNGGSQVVVGRELLSKESFAAVARELAPGSTVTELARDDRSLPVRLPGLPQPVQVTFSVNSGQCQMTFTRSGVEAGSISRAPAPSVPSQVPPSQSGAPGGMPSSSGAGRISVSDVQAKHDIDRILLRMIEMEASDVHLSAGTKPVVRVHGDITTLDDLDRLGPDDVLDLLRPVAPKRALKHFEERNDADFGYEIEGVSRFRVNIFRDRHGVGSVLRQIPVDVQTTEELGLPPVVTELSTLNKGLVLVTGPTGSGKSTTLAAIMDRVNQTRTDHVITIEDPIEFVHPNKKCLINQREVGTHTAGFRQALRAALREDPDVVLVGEMRDLETVSIALETAETGHLVFGTLHTTTAASTVDRIIDQFPEDRQGQIRVMLSESLKAVVAQTLLKRISGGRVAALEILINNGAVANLIRDGKTFQLTSVIQTARAQGMCLLNDSLIELVKKKIVSPEEAYAKASSRAALLQAFKASNIPLPSSETANAGRPGAPRPVAQ